MRSPVSFLLFLLSVLVAWIATSHAAALPGRALPLESTSLSSRNYDHATLNKRGCAFSRNVEESDGEEEPVYVCSSEVPSVDDLVAQIQSFGTVGRLDSLFYSGLDGGNAIPLAKQWYCSNVAGGRGAVAFDNIVDDGWYLAQAQALAGASSSKIDQFQKRLSQAFATASSGTVYFFTKQENDGTSMPTTLAWGGWEYPALTRNAEVSEIIQVDPTVDGDLGHVIWKQGDPVSATEPRG